MSRRPVLWLVAAALLIPLAGCGGSDDGGSAAAAGPSAAAAGEQAGSDGGGGGKAGDCPDLYGITFCMAYALTGSVTGTGTFPGTATNGTEKSPESCAEWAKGAPGGDDGEPHLYMPQGGPATATDVFAGLTGNVIEHYRGPGSYPKKELSGQGSPSGIITPASKDSFILVDGSTGTATVAADGSGSFTFTKLGTGQYGHPETVSGSVTWTCHD